MGSSHEQSKYDKYNEHFYSGFSLLERIVLSFYYTFSGGSYCMFNRGYIVYKYSSNKSGYD